MAPKKTESKGTFEIFLGKAGKTWFRLKAPNDEIILHSQGYKSMTGCKHGIESVKTNSQDEERFEKAKSKSGKDYFNLRAKNKEIIGTSQMYKGPSGRNHGIKSVSRWAPGAEIVDLTAQEQEGEEKVVLKRPAAAMEEDMEEEAEEKQVLKRPAADAPAAEEKQMLKRPAAVAPAAVHTIHIQGPVNLTIEGGQVKVSEEKEADEEEEEEEVEEEEGEEEEEEEVVLKKPSAAMKAVKKAATKAMKNSRTGVFEIFKGKSGKYFFRLRAANKEIILQSQAYTGLSGAKGGVESVKKNAVKSQFEIRKSKKGDPYFVLNAKGGTGSGKIIGTGETYQGGMGACKKGIQSVIKNAKTAPVNTVDE